MEIYLKFIVSRSVIALIPRVNWSKNVGFITTTHIRGITGQRTSWSGTKSASFDGSIVSSRDGTGNFAHTSPDHRREMAHNAGGTVLAAWEVSTGVNFLVPGVNSVRWAPSGSGGSPEQVFTGWTTFRIT